LGRLDRLVGGAQDGVMAAHASGSEPAGWYARPAARRWTCAPASGEVAGFHAGIPGYRPTPLVEVAPLAAELGVGRVLVKDESARLGLPAFKVLGASWAVCRVLAARAGDGAAPASWAGLCELAGGLGTVRLVTATDGNHGRAVARIARLLGLGAHVFLPEVAGGRAAAAVAAEGATVTVVAGSYDQAVRHAALAAEAAASAVLVQDTGWPGYERVPRWIVEGYSTLFAETDRQLRDAGAVAAGLVVVPVGVGSLAQAAVVHHRSRQAGRPAALLGVEPEAAACVLASLTAGRPRSVAAGATVMAGLNCPTPSGVAWPYLRDGLDAAVTVGDPAAARAVDDLARLGISSGPSGAASLAGARAALTGTGAQARRAALGVDGDATVVLVSTEGRQARKRPGRVLH
jgi:diaminopropionate ammonia-lyase